MIWFIIIPVAWFVFGYFAARMLLLLEKDTPSNPLPNSLMWLGFALGPITWVMSVLFIALDKEWKILFNAHFLPAIPLPKLPRFKIPLPNSELQRKFFGVKS